MKRRWSQEEIEVFDLLKKAQQVCIIRAEGFDVFEILIPKALESVKDEEAKRYLSNIYHSLLNLVEIQQGKKPTPYPSTPVYAMFATDGEDSETCICFDSFSANLHYKHMSEDYTEVVVATFPLSARSDIKEV